jgi:dipeptidyl-peptidase-4
MSSASHFASRLVFLLTVGLLYAGMTGPGQAQSLQINDLPGWYRVEQANEQLSALRFSPPENLVWEAGKLYFTVAVPGESPAHQVLDLASGQVQEVDPDAIPGRAGAAGDNRRRFPGVQRARQRTWIESPDRRWKASYRDYNVFLEALDEEGQPSGEPVAVTSEGTEKHRFGTACWVYGEELDQNDAMWFSPDSRLLAFYEIDEQHMKTYFLTTRNTQVYTALHTEQYPTAGEDNPHVALHILDLKSREKVRVNVDGPVDQYIYGIRFSPDSRELIFHRTNRWQNELDLMAADVTTGQTRKIVSESQETWQENSPLMQFLEDGQRFIWETEQTGWKQFQLRHLNGDKICDLTPAANYPAHQVVKVDEENGWFYYSAFSGDNPLDVHLHRSRLDGSRNQRLTAGEYNWSAFRISPDNDYFVASYETIACPPSTGLWKIGEAGCQRIATLVESDPQAVAAAGFVSGEVFSFKADDGQTDIYGTLYKPRDFDPSRKYPLLIDVYGGPHSVGVTNRFRAANAYCELGFLIAKIGNRGTVNRGKAFESANYLKLGLVDLDDQAAGVRYLAQRDYVDAGRVGISGHSYGGYMSALALLRYPDVFHVGVAGAPVTHWKNYDTIYTERYMRTPQENPEGYRQGSCLEHAGQLAGKLFILHGLVDDNVHPSNTWQLVDALHKAGKRFDLMIYPNSAHGFRYNQLKWEYFVRHLNPQPTPVTAGTN